MLTFNEQIHFAGGGEKVKISMGKLYASYSMAWSDWMTEMHLLTVSLAERQAGAPSLQ